MRKTIEDAAYTAVGLGVLALQEVRVRRRETRQCAAARLRGLRQRIESLSLTLQGLVDPVASRLPHPPVPPLLTRALDTGRAQVDSVLRRRSAADESSSEGSPAAAA